MEVKTPNRQSNSRQDKTFVANYALQQNANSNGMKMERNGMEWNGTNRQTDRHCTQSTKCDETSSHSRFDSFISFHHIELSFVLTTMLQSTCSAQLSSAER